jgi:hypothetical protein
LSSTSLPVCPEPVSATLAAVLSENRFLEMR